MRGTFTAEEKKGTRLEGLRLGPISVHHEAIRRTPGLVVSDGVLGGAGETHKQVMGNNFNINKNTQHSIPRRVVRRQLWFPKRVGSCNSTLGMPIN